MRNQTHNNVVPFRRIDPQTPHRIPSLADYQPALSGFDLTPDQQREFFEALWIILSAFVDLGFEIKPGTKLGASTNTSEAVLHSLQRAAA